MDTTSVAGIWRTPLIWRVLLQFARFAAPLVCRLRVTGDLSPGLRRGPVILAANHIGNFDPVAFTAACGRRHLGPRIMATGGLFRAPVVGAVMTRSGHIRVDRGYSSVGDAVQHAVDALNQNSIIMIYPEGRIGLDPAVWPERAKTGIARIALASGATVVPVAQWGSHEVIAYHGRGPMLRTLISSIWRRPVVRVHFGTPVDLSGLHLGEVGHAQRATDRIIDAVTVELAGLRRDEPRLPRHIDETRPLSTARRHRPGHKALN